MTPYAVRCVKHGRVVLNWEEAMVHDPDHPHTCPICGEGARLDNHWFEKTKNHLPYW